MLGASRMSSVPGLKASPHSAMVRPFMSGPNSSTSFSKSHCFCTWLRRSTAFSTIGSKSTERAMLASACTSLGRQEPP